MAMRLDYVVRETTNNLLRNLLLTVASIITFGVSLGILGGALLFVAGVDHAFERWKDGVEFIVYMQPGADQEKIDQVEGKLAASPQVSDITFVDTEKTFKEFQQLFRDDPDIVASVEPQDLPQSFRVTPTNPQSNVVSELGQSFQNEPGVYKVEFALGAVKQMESFLSNLSTFFIVLAVVLLVATALLIVFMIQTAVFARRRDRSATPGGGNQLVHQDSLHPRGGGARPHRVGGCHRRPVGAHLGVAHQLRQQGRAVVLRGDLVDRRQRRLGDAASDRRGVGRRCDRLDAVGLLVSEDLVRPGMVAR